MRMKNLFWKLSQQSIQDVSTEWEYVISVYLFVVVAVVIVVVWFVHHFIKNYYCSIRSITTHYNFTHSQCRNIRTSSRRGLIRKRCFCGTQIHSSQSSPVRLSPFRRAHSVAQEHMRATSCRCNHLHTKKRALQWIGRRLRRAVSSPEIVPTTSTCGSPESLSGSAVSHSAVTRPPSKTCSFLRPKPPCSLLAPPMAPSRCGMCAQTAAKPCFRLTLTLATSTSSHGTRRQASCSLPAPTTARSASGICGRSPTRAHLPWALSSGTRHRSRRLSGRRTTSPSSPSLKRKDRLASGICLSKRTPKLSRSRWRKKTRTWKPSPSLRNSSSSTKDKSKSKRSTGITKVW